MSADDYAAIRKNLVKLAGVQAALLAAILLFFVVARPDDARGTRFLLAMAVLPLLLGAWGWLYWQAIERERAKDGGTAESLRRANRFAIRVLGALVGAWVLALAVALFLP